MVIHPSLLDLKLLLLLHPNLEDVHAGYVLISHLHLLLRLSDGLLVELLA